MECHDARVRVNDVLPFHTTGAATQPLAPRSDPRAPRIAGIMLATTATASSVPNTTGSRGDWLNSNGAIRGAARNIPLLPNKFKQLRETGVRLLIGTDAGAFRRISITTRPGATSQDSQLP